MSETCVLHRRVTAIMDTLSAAAVTEICKLVQDSYAALRVEASQSKKEIKMLKERLKMAEMGNKSVSAEAQTPVSDFTRIDSPSSDMSEVEGDAGDSDFEGDELVMVSVTGSQHTLWKTGSTAADNKVAPSEMPVSPKTKVVASVTPVPPKTMTTSSTENTMKEKLLQQHITCFRVGETPKIQQCTTCCSLYHCPFCKPAIFKPNEFHRVVPHIQSHLRSAIQNDDFIIYKCNLTCRNSGHFHCCYCGETRINKLQIQRHLPLCRQRPLTLTRSQPQTPSAPPTQHPAQHAPPCSTPDDPTTQNTDMHSTPVARPDISSLEKPDNDTSTSQPPFAPSSLASELLASKHMESEPIESEPSSPEAYSSPPTPQMEVSIIQKPSAHHVERSVFAPVQNWDASTTTTLKTESSQSREGESRESKDFKIQCDHCGIILNKKNFKVHMKRKHKEELRAAEKEEDLKRCLEESKMGIVRKHKVKVRCDRCGITLNKKNFKLHMKRKHKEDVKSTAFEEALNKCLAEQGLFAIESSLLASRLGTPGGRGEDHDDDLILDMEMGGEQSTAYPDSHEVWTLVTQQLQGERVLAAMNSQRYLGLGKPHLLELPLESLVWIFREVICKDGRRGYWNLSLVCKTFHTILRNDIIRKYAAGQVCD